MLGANPSNLLVREKDESIIHTCGTVQCKTPSTTSMAPEEDEGEILAQH